MNGENGRAGMDGLSSWVRGIDNDVKEQSRKIGSLETNMENVMRSLDNVSSVLNSLNNKITHDSRTNWSVLAAWAGVIIGVIGSLGYLSTQPLKEELIESKEARIRLWERVREVEKEFHAHETKDWHSSMGIKVGEIEKRIDFIQNEQAKRSSHVYGTNK